jgi:L-lactate dehydrogenase complex protein LldG
VDGETRCGLAATVGDESHHYTTEPAVPRAGCLIDIPAHDLAKFIYSDSLPEVSVGLATVNALLPRIHLALGRPDMHQVFAEAKDSNYLVFITGPRRIANIELTTTLGVHGPKELFVWILEG